MRYLKKIFENDSNKVDKDELQDFCETYLAYLLDDTKFILEIFDSIHYLNHVKWNSYIIWINGYSDSNPEGDFTWNEISDYYIPFVTMLSREYNLDSSRLGASIIVNFTDYDQIFLDINKLEDKSFQCQLGKYRAIREIGVVVKDTIKK